MAEYTIELKDVVNSGHKIFDFKYPFYDENKRPDFEKSFIRHFYFREIGAPTIDRFKVYLEDKMNTVFPYYNELFNAAQIEYSVLDNYKLTETFTHTVEDSGKSSGVSSTVGQYIADQNSENNGNRVVDSVGNVDTIGKDTDTETTHTETENNGSSSTESNSNTETESNSTKNGSGNKESVRKFLDTPQGRTDLSDSKYLTTLNHDTDSDTHTETVTDSQTVNGSTTGSTETSETGSSDTTRNGERNTLQNTESSGKETTVDGSSGTVHDEQRSTQDNNTRMYNDNKRTEQHELVRSGNIGVDTDSDMIEKHIRLQKTLRNIERMFFDECEDLFMLVY